MNNTTFITKTFDIDPNASIQDLLTFLSDYHSKLISINPQNSLPVPSITIQFPSIFESDLDSIFSLL